MDHKRPTTPLTPIHTRKPSRSDDSPTHTYHTLRRRRTSSFSSKLDRSPITPRSRHRFSNSSAYSAGGGSLEDEDHSCGNGGLGNLADELDQLDDDEDDYDLIEEDIDGEKGVVQEVTRDSGIDVSYTDDRRKIGVHSKSAPDEEEEIFPATMDDAIDDLARVIKQSADSMDDQTIPQYRACMLKLQDQAAIESGIQRLNTSTNSMAAHLTKEVKTMHTLSISLFSPYGLRDTLDYQALEESLPLIDTLVLSLPQPDTAILQSVRDLLRETEQAIQTNLSLADSVQDYKQPYEAASRYLRDARKQVARFRVEQEEADIARLELSKNIIPASDAASQCKDIVSGFETFCESLRTSWSEAIEAAA